MSGYDINTVFGVGLQVAGALGIVGGAGVVIFKVIRPVMDIVHRVEELERRSVLDFKNIGCLKEFTEPVCVALMALLDNRLDDNHTGEIKDARSLLQSYLISNKK